MRLKKMMAEEKGARPNSPTERSVSFAYTRHDENKRRPGQAPLAQGDHYLTLIDERQFAAWQSEPVPRSTTRVFLANVAQAFTPWWYFQRVSEQPRNELVRGRKSPPRLRIRTQTADYKRADVS
jgi:hypothetical protein